MPIGLRCGFDFLIGNPVEKALTGKSLVGSQGFLEDNMPTTGRLVGLQENMTTHFRTSVNLNSNSLRHRKLRATWMQWFLLSAVKWSMLGIPYMEELAWMISKAISRMPHLKPNASSANKGATSKGSPYFPVACPRFPNQSEC